MRKLRKKTPSRVSFLELVAGFPLASANSCQVCMGEREGEGMTPRILISASYEKRLPEGSLFLELVAGFEPATCSLRVSCSAS